MRTDSLSNTENCTQLEHRQRLRLSWNQGSPSRKPMFRTATTTGLSRCDGRLHHERRCVRGADRFHSDVGRHGMPIAHRGNSQSHSQSPEVGSEYAIVVGGMQRGQGPAQCCSRCWRFQRPSPQSQLRELHMSGPTAALTGCEALRACFAFQRRAVT